MFKENLTKVLNEKEITLEDLEKDSRIPLEKIQWWMKGATLPSYLAIVILCKTLDVTPKELIGVDINMNDLPKEIEFKANFYMNYTKKIVCRNQYYRP